VARRVIRFDELLVEEKPLQDVPRAASAAAMLEGVRSMGLDALPWDDDARDFQARCEFVRKLERKDLGDWPDFSSPALAQDLSWLEPFLEGATRRSQLSRVSVVNALRARLTYEQQRKLDSLAPTHIDLPTGTRARIDYLDDNGAHRVDAHAGSVRPRGDAAYRWWNRCRDVHVVVARAKAAADHPRPRELLAQRLPGSAEGHARKVSAALLAGESARGGTHAAREAARDVT
jgi:HrpA-like RNA helicase